MVHLEIQNLSFTYPEQASPALTSIELIVPEGQFLLVCGPSGCGKSTLLQQLKSELTPTGCQTGRIYLSGRPLSEWSSLELAGSIGMVMQDPEQQIVMDHVLSELAFAMENLGMEPRLMRRRMAEVARAFHIEGLLEQSTDQLSGGQKQLMNLASVLMLQPKLLLLDEPTAQLDPIAARSFLHLLHDINRELGITVIMVEHRLEEAISFADRLIFMEQGGIRKDGPTRQVLRELYDGSKVEKSYVPELVRLALDVDKGEEDQLPLSVKDAKQWLAQLEGKAAVNAQLQLAAAMRPDHPVKMASRGLELLSLKHIDYRYEKNQSQILQGLDWTIYAQDSIALFGGNGSGKSTLLKVAAGLLKPQTGKRKWLGLHSGQRIAYLPQNPMALFLHDRLEDEFIYSAKLAGYGNPAETAKETMERFGLLGLKDQHPYDLSGGERQMAAMACLMLNRPALLLLDEPTKGLDPSYKLELADHLVTLQREGIAMIMATHDVEFAARTTQRSALLFHGEIAADAPTEDFLEEGLYYTTAMHRIGRNRGGER